MSGKNIDVAKLKVSVEASTAPYKKEMEKAKQISKSVASSINKEMEKVKAPLESVTSGNKALNSIRNFQKKLKISLSSISGKDISGGLKDRIKQFQLDSGIKVYTDEFVELDSKIERTLRKLDLLGEKKAKLKSLGVDKESREWKSLAYDIQKTNSNLHEYITQKNKMESSGTDVQRPQSLGSSLTGLVKGAASKGWGGMSRIFGGMKSVLDSVIPAIRKTSGVFGALIQKFKTGIPFINRTKSSFNGLGTSGRGLSGILKTVGMTAKFMFASFLIRGALDGAKEGFQNLAQYSNATNRSISTLMSSLIQLKNALAAAFAPILNVTAPILDFLIQKVISVVNVFGQLTSALTGSSVYIRAKKVNQDYAASLQDNASSADKAQKANVKLQRTILGFDQINKLDSSTSNNSGLSADSSIGGVSADDMFETVRIQNKVSEFARQLKEAWTNADFTEIGAIVGSKLNAALSNIPWDGIQNTCNRIAQSTATFLNGFLAATDWSLVGSTVSSGINVAFGIANTFAQAFDWSGLGLAAGNGINGGLAGINWNGIQETLHNAVSGIINSINTFVQTADWNLVGTTIGQYWNSKLEIVYTAVSEFDWQQAGQAFGSGINGIITTFDWEKAGQTVSDCVKGVLNFGIQAIEQTDWKQIGENAKAYLENIDWNGIADRAFELLGAGFGGLASFLGGLIGEKVTEAKNFFAEAIELCGGDIVMGLTYGITTGLKNIGGWIKEHIFEPFINGFKEVFGIHSPSTVMAEMGGYLMDGLLGGIKDLVEDVVGVFTEIGDRISEAWDAITSKTSETWENIKTTVSDTWENLTSTASEKFEAIRTSVSDTWDMIKSKGEEVWKSVSETVGTVWDDLTTSASEKFSSIQESVTTAWESAKTTASDTWDNVKTKVGGIWDWLLGRAEDDFPEIQKNAEDAFSNTEKTSDTAWSNSQDSVNNALNSMKSASSKSMRQIYTTVKSYTDSIYNITVNNWKAASKRVTQLLEDMNLAVSEELQNTVDVFLNLGNRISSSMGGLYEAGRNAAQSFANGFQSVHIPTPHLYTSSWTKHYTNADRTSWYSTPNYAVQWYASGGFPDMGEMFVARENGPELVGRMGRKNAVANNNQIVDGIKAGVFEAVMDAFHASGLLDRDSSDKQVVLEFTFMADDETVYKIARKGQKKYDNRYHVVETI